MKGTKLIIMFSAMLLASYGEAKDTTNISETPIGKSDIQIKGGRMTPEALWSMGRM